MSDDTFDSGDRHIDMVRARVARQDAGKRKESIEARNKRQAHARFLGTIRIKFGKGASRPSAVVPVLHRVGAWVVHHDTNATEGTEVKGLYTLTHAASGLAVFNGAKGSMVHYADRLAEAKVGAHGTPHAKDIEPVISRDEREAVRREARNIEKRAALAAMTPAARRKAEERREFLEQAVDMVAGAAGKETRADIAARSSGIAYNLSDPAGRAAADHAKRAEHGSSAFRHDNPEPGDKDAYRAGITLKEKDEIEKLRYMKLPLPAALLPAAAAYDAVRFPFKRPKYDKDAPAIIAAARLARKDPAQFVAEREAAERSHDDIAAARGEHPDAVLARLGLRAATFIDVPEPAVWFYGEEHGEAIARRDPDGQLQSDNLHQEEGIGRLTFQVKPERIRPDTQLHYSINDGVPSVRISGYLSASVDGKRIDYNVALKGSLVVRVITVGATDGTRHSVISEIITPAEAPGPVQAAATAAVVPPPAPAPAIDPNMVDSIRLADDKRAQRQRNYEREMQEIAERRAAREAAEESIPPSNPPLETGLPAAPAPSPSRDPWSSVRLRASTLAAIHAAGKRYGLRLEATILRLLALADAATAAKS